MLQFQTRLFICRHFASHQNKTLCNFVLRSLLNYCWAEDTAGRFGRYLRALEWWSNSAWLTAPGVSVVLGCMCRVACSLCAPLTQPKRCLTRNSIKPTSLSLVQANITSLKFPCSAHYCLLNLTLYRISSGNVGSRSELGRTAWGLSFWAANSRPTNLPAN